MNEEPNPLISSVLGAVLDALHRAGIHPNCAGAGSAYELDDAAPIGIEVTLFYTTAAAQGIEAATAAETVQQGSVHESPVGNADAPKLRGGSHG